MKTNKVIASALAFIMATTTMAAGSVFAAGETVTISAGKAEVAAGAEFTIDIMLSDVPATGIMGCEFALNYDANVLSISDVAAGAVANTGSDGQEPDISGEAPSFYVDSSTAGTINLTWSTGLSDSAYWIAKDGVFATITGKVAADAADGSYPISIVPIARDDLSGANSAIYVGYIDANKKAVEYDTAVIDGEVIVGKKTMTTTTTTETTTQTTATTTTGGKDTTTTSTQTTVGNKPTGVVGDVNLDEGVSLIDVVFLNKYLAKSVTFNETQMANAECVADGDINAGDTSALLQYIIQLIDALPVIPA